MNALPRAIGRRGSRRTGTPRLRPRRRLSGSLRRGPLASVAPSCAIMAVYRPDATSEIALLSRRIVTARPPRVSRRFTGVSTTRRRDVSLHDSSRSRRVSARSDTPVARSKLFHPTESFLFQTTRVHFYRCRFRPLVLILRARKG